MPKRSQDKGDRTSASEPADAGDGADASDGGGEWLDDHRHLVAAGVDHVFAVDHDADMAAGPEDKIAAAQLRLPAACDGEETVVFPCRNG